MRKHAHAAGYTMTVLYKGVGEGPIERVIRNGKGVCAPIGGYTALGQMIIEGNELYAGNAVGRRFPGHFAFCNGASLAKPRDPKYQGEGVLMPLNGISDVMVKYRKQPYVFNGPTCRSRETAIPKQLKSGITVVYHDAAYQEIVKRVKVMVPTPMVSSALLKEP